MYIKELGRKMMGQSRSTDLDLPIYMGEIRRKIMGLAEVQIWISLNVYRGIRKKNDGSEPKYRFVFA